MMEAGEHDWGLRGQQFGECQSNNIVVGGCGVIFSQDCLVVMLILGKSLQYDSQKTSHGE